MKKNRV